MGKSSTSLSSPICCCTNKFKFQQTHVRRDIKIIIIYEFPQHTKTTHLSFLSFFTGLFSSLVTCQSQPKYSLNNMPRTGFTCRDKILGGYYADPGKKHTPNSSKSQNDFICFLFSFLETNCQMFHICVKVAGVGVSDWLNFSIKKWCFCGTNNGHAGLYHLSTLLDEIVTPHLMSHAECHRQRIFTIVMLNCLFCFYSTWPFLLSSFF